MRAPARRTVVATRAVPAGSPRQQRVSASAAAERFAG